MHDYAFRTVFWITARNELLPRKYPATALNPINKSIIIARLLAVCLTLFITVGIAIWQIRLGVYGAPIPFLYYMLEIIYLTNKSKKYSLIDAVVVRNEFLRISNTTSPEFLLEYVYTINGISYRANRYSFVTSTVSNSLHLKHSINTTIPVFYNNDFPYQVVIHRGFDKEIIGFLFFLGIVFVGVTALSFTDLALRGFR